METISDATSKSGPVSLKEIAREIKKKMRGREVRKKDRRFLEKVILERKYLINRTLERLLGIARKYRAGTDISSLLSLWCKENKEKLDHLQDKIYYLQNSINQTNRLSANRIFVARHEVLVDCENLQSNFYCVGDKEMLKSLEQVVNSVTPKGFPEIKIIRIKEGETDDYRFQLLYKGLVKFDQRKKE